MLPNLAIPGLQEALRAGEVQNRHKHAARPRPPLGHSNPESMVSDPVLKMLLSLIFIWEMKLRRITSRRTS